MQTRSRFRPGFTLVEMMMVAVVMAILMSMLGVAVYQARIAAKNAQVVHEVAQMDAAIEKYKSDLGQYPGDGAARVAAHMKRRFPRYNFSTTIEGERLISIESYQYDLTAVQQADDDEEAQILGVGSRICNYASLDQAESLVLWLAGPPKFVPFDKDADPTVGVTSLVGFSMIPDAPLAVGNVARQPARFEFDPDRLEDADTDGWPEYRPPVNGDTPPYVYFDSDSLDAAAGGGVVRYPGNAPQGDEEEDPSLGPTNKVNSWGFAVPYKRASNQAANAGRFQIIAAGQDMHFGTADSRSFPGAGGNDADNITNLSTGTLGAAQP